MPPVGLFFLLALGITWVLQAPALLAHLGVLDAPVERFLLPAALGGFGPLIAALVAARREEPGHGARVVFRGLRIAGLAPAWYPFALLLFPAVYVASRAAFAVLSPGSTLPWLYLPENAQQIAAMIVVPIAEEPGWRGFALPRLIAHHGPVRATAIVGVAWAAWHLAMFLLSTPLPSPSLFAWSLANIFAGAFVFTWLFLRTQGSLLVAILAHAGAHLNNPGHAPPTDSTPMALYTVGVTIVALTLAVGDCGAWRRPTPA